MDLAMDILIDLDSDCVLATDGSIEGLLTGLSTRAGRPSVFLRDEFSGLLEALSKKDYYAGMAETFTKLYDGKFQKRMLRKETIEVREPILIFFAGGIKTRILELLTPEQVMSGFIPRFVLITAESDVSMLRPLGPPTENTLEGRGELIDRLKEMRSHYVRDELVTVDGRNIAMPRRWDGQLTKSAWVRYNQFEAQMLESALDSPQREMMTPAFDRMSKTGLKIALLMAAARQTSDRVVVEEIDIIRAFYYVEQWREHTKHVIQNLGRSQSERTLEQILNYVRKQEFVMRSQLMQYYHLNARDAGQVLDTLEQRGLITRTKSGRSEKIQAVA